MALSDERRGRRKPPPDLRPLFSSRTFGERLRKHDEMGWSVMERMNCGTLLLAGFFSSNVMPFISSASRSPTILSQKGDMDRVGSPFDDEQDGRVELSFIGSLMQII